MPRISIAAVSTRPLRNLIRTLACVALALALSNQSYAAEQWGWIAEVRRGTVLEASDPTVYPNQQQAKAAMRALLPPFSQVLTVASPGHGNPFNGSIQIEYSAPLTPVILGQPVYTIGLNPIFFGFPPDLSNPLNAQSDDELADAINERLKAQGNAVCADRDRAVVVEPLWGGWILTSSSPGTLTITGKNYTYTDWSGIAAQPGVCYDFGRASGNVWRTREENCPAGYDRIAARDSNSIGSCFSSKTGVVRGTPHQCEVTPVSPLVGNPCDTTTGAKTESVTDYSSDTLQLVRSYNSHAQVKNSFGPGWIHNYDRELSISRATRGSPLAPSMLIRPDGVANLLRFRLYNNSESTWQSTSGNGIIVRRETPNYRAYLRSGAQELYNASGALIELVDAAGRSTIIERDELDRVSTVTGPYGKQLQFEYDDDGRLAQVIDPAGNPISYGYASNGALVSVTYPDTSQQILHYENSGLPFHLTGITDENGDRYSTYSYDSIGRAIHSTHADGFEAMSLVYEPTQTIVTDAAGTERIFQFTTDTTKLRKLTAVVEADAITTIVTPSYNSDIQRRATQLVDANGIVTEFGYDAFHKVSETKASGTPEERTTTYEYLSDFSSLVTIESTSSVFDGDFKRVITEYGDDNLPDSTTISGFTPSGDPVERTFSFEYNAFGQRTKIDGPRTDVADITQFEYYECTFGGECGQLRSMTNALGHTTTFDEYDAHGRVLRRTDPNGLATLSTYDLRGRLVAVTERSPEDVERTMLFVYDPAGQLVSTTYPDGLIETSTYNAAHLLVRTEDNHGNRIEYGYDLRGNQTSVETYDPDGILRRARETSYDIRNSIESINSGGFVTSQLYDPLGNLRETTDPASATTQYEYDGLDRVIRTTDAELGVSTMRYDSQDNIIEVVAANGAVTSYEYDDLGNLLRETSPDRGTAAYTHDAAGNTVSETDGRGLTTLHVFDALSRRTSSQSQDGQVHTYEYDGGVYGTGRLTRIVDSSGETEWLHDAFGQVLSRRQVTNGISLSTSHVYDSAGRVVSTTLPSGRSVARTYDTNQLRGISTDGLPIVADISYTAFNQIDGWTWGDSTTHARTYDLRGLMSSITIGAENRVMEYDPAGRLASQLDSRRAYDYDYDLLGRLTTSTPTLDVGAPEPWFTATPAVLVSLQTMNNEVGAIPSSPSEPWMTVAVQNVTDVGGEVALERGQSSAGTISVPEEVGFIAIEAVTARSFVDSAGQTIALETQVTPSTIGSTGGMCLPYAFASGFSAAPLVVGSLNSHNDDNGGWLRGCSLSRAAVGLTVDKDVASRGRPVAGATQSAGLAVFSQPFAGTFDAGSNPWRMEAGEATIPAEGVTFVPFQQPYPEAPVVAVLPTQRGPGSSAVRIRNVTGFGFEAVRVQAIDQRGQGREVAFAYLAVDEGAHELPDGTHILAGRQDTQDQQHGPAVTGSESWAEISFFANAGGTAIPQAFEYDANGNRTLLKNAGQPYPYVYSPGSNRLVSTAGPEAKNITYDGTGNILSDGSSTFDYDGHGRLVAVDGGVESYDYNALGQRVFKQGADARIFVYDESRRLLGEYDASGVALHEHVYLGDQPVAVLAGADTYLVHGDHLGTPREITSNGEAIWRWDSHPFGLGDADSDVDGDSLRFEYALRFPGQYFDESTGLHYNYYRTYDPSIGRYLESDPIGLAAGPNTYSYVSNMPTMRTDKYGLYEGGGISEVMPGYDYEDYLDVIDDMEYRPPSPFDRCVAKCAAKRLIICQPFSMAGSSCGVTVAGIASIPSGGTTFPGFARVGTAVGGFTGNALCRYLMFEESCAESCSSALGSELAQ